MHFILDYSNIILNNKSQEQIISHVNLAIANNNGNLFRQILREKTDLNLSKNEITPSLFNAIFFGNYEFTKMLLANGDNVNLQDHCGTTPLHCAFRAIAGNKEQIIRLLLENGASLNIKDNHGKTPAEYKP